MANFNRVSHPNRTLTYEGGIGFEKNLEEDWTNMLFSCMLEDRFYETGSEQMNRFLFLTEQMGYKYGTEFIAKAALYARNEIGIRSISQLLAARLNDCKFDHKRSFYRSFCHRPDDVAEVFAATESLGYKRSHGMVRGFGDYLSSLNAYALDKYKMMNRDFNIFDCINITHAHSKNIDALKAGTLQKANTWEQKISASTFENKSESWFELVESGSLGYLALLRNLRNIVRAYESFDSEYATVIKQLTSEASIRKSLVYPYQIYTAYCGLVDSGIYQYSLFDALEKAFILSVDNMPVLDGINCIVLDVSGSMESRLSANSSITIKDCGACYGIAIAIKNPGCRIIKFGTSAAEFVYSKSMGIFNAIDKMCHNDGLGYGTSIDRAFELMFEKKIDADRIFIISDMQVMKNDYCGYLYRNSSALDTFNRYVNFFGPTKLYSFDLGNYHSQIANPNNKDVHLLTSLSPKVFDFIRLSESGINLVDYINRNYSF